MSVHCTEERNELPAKICKFCNQQDVYYVDYDPSNEFAEACVTYCGYYDEHGSCPLTDIDWAEFIKSLKEKT